MTHAIDWMDLHVPGVWGLMMTLPLLVFQWLEIIAGDGLLWAFRLMRKVIYSRDPALLTEITLGMTGILAGIWFAGDRDSGVWKALTKFIPPGVWIGLSLGIGFGQLVAVTFGTHRHRAMASVGSFLLWLYANGLVALRQGLTSMHWGLIPLWFAAFLIIFILDPKEDPNQCRTNPPPQPRLNGGGE